MDEVPRYRSFCRFLEAALRNNKAYWKFSGLFTIVSLVFALLLVIILFAAKALG
ncbi:MAG: hypothetical protein LBP37_02175 [Spirochaetaceae bacterium]|nr:hypothetical protein [Spirochaetaceae bacterium]